MKRFFYIMLCTIALLFTANAFADDMNPLFVVYAPTEISLKSTYGYANLEGRIVIPPIYDQVFGTSDGVIIVSKETDVDRSVKGDVMFSKVNASELIGLDDAGNVLFKVNDIVEVKSYSDGMICVETKEGFGYVNTQGEFIIPPKYKKWRDFKDGYGIVSLDEKNYAVIDKEGNILLSYRDDLVGYLGEGLFKIQDLRTDKYGCIDINGNIVIDCEWDYMNVFHEGLCEVKQNEKYEFINTEGSIVVPCEYDSVGAFSDGLAPVQKNSVWGYVDHKGEIKIPLKWDDARSFSEGLAEVKDYKWGYINIEGELVIPCKYALSYSFENELASVKEEFEDELFYIDKNGKYVMEKCVDVSKYEKNGNQYSLIDVDKRPEGTIALSKEDETSSDNIEDSNTNEFKPIKKGSKGDEVKRIQERLTELGYSVGKADGDYGNKTTKAVEKFQADNGLDVTGVVDEETYNALFPSEGTSSSTDDLSDKEIEDEAARKLTIIADAFKELGDVDIDGDGQLSVDEIFQH